MPRYLHLHRGARTQTGTLSTHTHTHLRGEGLSAEAGLSTSSPAPPSCVPTSTLLLHVVLSCPRPAWGPWGQGLLLPLNHQHPCPGPCRLFCVEDLPGPASPATHKHSFFHSKAGYERGRQGSGNNQESQTVSRWSVYRAQKLRWWKHTESL